MIDTLFIAAVVLVLLISTAAQWGAINRLREDVQALRPQAAPVLRVLAPEREPVARAPLLTIAFTASRPAFQTAAAPLQAAANLIPRHTTRSERESGAQVGSLAAADPGQQASVPMLPAVVTVAAAQAKATRAPEVPTRLRLLLEREAESVFGLSAPVALFAAQIQQESEWKPEAASKYAQGLTQFTPKTAEWIGTLYPEDLQPVDVWDPAWAVRAQIRYMRDLVLQFDAGATRCDDWAFALAGYNGGPGWVRRDQAQTTAAGGKADVWFDQVELHSSRSKAAKRENRGYVRRILLTLEAQYLLAGWAGSATCGGVARAGG